MTPHNEAKKEEICKTVIMPGDPLRAKYIAENFLQNAKLVNSIRGMYAYTGTYKNKPITVMAHGMGIPSAGIYIYELFKFYDVDSIIRIGSCGAFDKNLNLFDTILVNTAYTESNFSYTLYNENVKQSSSTSSLNSIIETASITEKIPLINGNVLCTDCFDPYLKDASSVIKRQPQGSNIIASEMESFVLFYLAQKFSKKASCLLTVVNTVDEATEIPAEQRDKSLNNMIVLALNSAVNI
ncbi:MAG: purine-nucleoside phosphorylase [Lachnospiraceae bacterium]|jgi:purine-nucleoside phosphorylase|nr:purine-nucleoside phosphorylase [Lachnospiraceae bacterium]